jgi:hypothetical protein
MRYVVSSAFLAVLIAGVPGCEAPQVAPGQELGSSTAALEACGEAKEADLVSGRRKIDYGSVQLWNDASHLYVRIEADPGFALAATQLHGGYKLSDIPQANGNPIPGHFDTRRTYDAPRPYDEWVFEVGAPAGTEIVTAAHVELVALGPKDEVVGYVSAWEDGFPFPGKSVGLWNNYVIQGCPPVVPDGEQKLEGERGNL